MIEYLIGIPLSLLIFVCILVFMPNSWRTWLSNILNGFYNLMLGILKRFAKWLWRGVKILFILLIVMAAIHLIVLYRGNSDELVKLFAVDFVIVLGMLLFTNTISKRFKTEGGITKALCLLLLGLGSVILVAAKGPQFYEAYKFWVWLAAMSLFVLLAIGTYLGVKSNAPIRILTFIYFVLAFTFLSSPSQSLDTWFEGLQLKDTESAVKQTRKHFKIRRNIEKSQVQLIKETIVYKNTGGTLAAKKFIPVKDNSDGLVILPKTSYVDVDEHGKIIDMWGSTPMTRVILDVNNVGANIDTLWIHTESHSVVVKSVVVTPEIVYTNTDSIDTLVGYSLTFTKPRVQLEVGKKIICEKSPALLNKSVILKVNTIKMEFLPGMVVTVEKIYKTDSSFVVFCEEHGERIKIEGVAIKLSSGDVKIKLKKI